MAKVRQISVGRLEAWNPIDIIVLEGIKVMK